MTPTTFEYIGKHVDRDVKRARRALERSTFHRPRHARPANDATSQRFGQCDETCTTDCGHCKGVGPVVALVTRGGDGGMAGRPDIRLLPLTGPQSPGEAW